MILTLARDNSGRCVGLQLPAEPADIAAAYEKLNAAQLKYADVNKDGAVDINDATAVQKYIAGIIKSFD